MTVLETAINILTELIRNPTRLEIVASLCVEFNRLLCQQFELKGDLSECEIDTVMKVDESFEENGLPKLFQNWYN
jgi:hypothetical protein